MEMCVAEERRRQSLGPLAADRVACCCNT